MEILFPQTVVELQTLLSHTPGGLIMAGGTDLLVKLRKSGQLPPALFCLERLAEFQQIENTEKELFIGAGVTLQRLLECKTVKEEIPVLWQAMTGLASPPIRHVATLVGNLCTASPAGDTLPPLYVLGTLVEIERPNGRCRMPVSDFVMGPGKTALQSGEFVTGVAIPLPTPGIFSMYYKVGKRKSMAIAVASLAVLIETTEEGLVKKIKLAWGSVGPTVMTVPAVENILAGKVLSMEGLRMAGAIAAAAVNPIEDIRASAGYRRQLAGNLLLRLLEGPLGIWEGDKCVESTNR
jgi:CO/xanthine dehydrogenase FAD-binding subunit